MKRACHDADEYDAFSRWRRVHGWGRGELRRIKRQASKRERRRARTEIRTGGE